MELSSAGVEQLRKTQPLVVAPAVCRNCNQVIDDNYCGKCGSPVALKRVDGHYIVHEIQHVLHFEKGILYTVKALLTQPGKSVRSFISDDRSRLVKPVIFIIVTSLVYTIVAHLFHAEKPYIYTDLPEQSAVSAIMKWVQGHYGYANILMGGFIAGWLKLLFRKSSYNFFEILIMLCFVIGTGMLLLAVFAAVQAFTGVNPGGLILIYLAWAIGQFFDGRKISSYLYSLIAYVLGMASFMIIASLIGISIDLLRRAL